MKKQKLIVPEGKDLAIIWVTNHNYVILRDIAGHELSRFQSKGQHFTIVVEPGEYKLETDGEFKKVSVEKLDADLQVPNEENIKNPIELD